jgi:hypothetical protein
MGEFFENVSRYPRYFISFGLGILLSIIEWIRPLFRDRATSIALVGILVGLFSFLYFTLKAMLGLTTVA